MFDRNAQLLGIETSKARSVRTTLRRLWVYFRKYLLILVLVTFALLASTYMQVLIPGLVGQAVDCYLGPFSAGSQISEALTDIPPGGSSTDIPNTESNAFTNCWFTTPDPQATAGETLAGLGILVLNIVGLYIGSAVLSGLTFFLMSWSGYRALRDMRQDVFQHIHRLTLGFFSKQEAGNVMSRLTNDIDTIQQIIGFGLISVFQSGLLIGWIVLRMFSTNALYAVISLVTLPLMFLVTRWLSTQARKSFRRARMEIGSVNADLQEGISAVREVQAFSRETENIEQFRTSNAANRDANIRAQAYSSALAPSLEALSYVSLAVVAVIGGVAMLIGQGILGATMSIGLIITFIAYTQQFNRPVQQISVMWTNLQSAIAGAERIFDLLDEVPEITDKENAVSIPLTKGYIRFDDVWAEYNQNEPVLKGISIKTKPGDTIAIVGPTGAGKTTIIKLLPRFMDVVQGSVMVDGRDVRDMTRRSLRLQIGIVLQDTFLFSDSVANNIRYGRPDASDEDVHEAARLAQADDFINHLENGYDTILGERGTGLSLGQRQLLAIARVALKDPQLLILDEATSSVDTRTEKKIQAALNKLLEGRTSFVIAHRLSTIRNADQVLVLNQGQIIEQGTHDELLSAKGFYYDLYLSQFRRQSNEVNLKLDAIDQADAFFVPSD